MENVTQSGNCSIYDNQDYINVAIVYQIVAGFAFLACLFSISIIIIFKKWQRFSHRLFLYLVLTTLLFAIARVFHRVDYLEDEFTAAARGFCIFIAFLSQNLAWMIFNSNLSLTVYLFLAVVFNRYTDKYEVLYILYIFVFPWTFNWIPLTISAYGRAGAWCWIKGVDIDTCERIELGVTLQLVLFFVPFFIFLVAQLVLYLLIMGKLYITKRRLKGTTINKAERVTNKVIRKEVYSLLAYPLIYILTSIPIIGNRIQGWAAPGRPSLLLWYLSAIAFPLQGLIIVLVFTFSTDTRRRLKWSHLRAAIKNYNPQRTVTEYDLGEMESEVEYTSYTDTASADKPDLNSST